MRGLGAKVSKGDCLFPRLSVDIRTQVTIHPEYVPLSTPTTYCTNSTSLLCRISVSSLPHTSCKAENKLFHLEQFCPVPSKENALWQSRSSPASWAFLYPLTTCASHKLNHLPKKIKVVFSSPFLLTYTQFVYYKILLTHADYQLIRRAIHYEKDYTHLQ